MDNESIDLIRLLRVLRKRILVIMLIALLGLGLSGVWTFFVVDELYSADVLLYIWQDKNADDEQAVSSGDLALFSQLVSDYQVLAKSRLVTSMVVAELELDPARAAGLSNKIAVGTRSNTRHLTITVTDQDPVFAAMVANKVADVFSRVVVDKMGAGNVNIIDDAFPPGSPSSPNKQLNLAIGLILGLMAGIGLALLIEFLDTTVKSAEDVEALTGYTLLGAIPEYEHEQNTGSGRRR